MPKTSRFCLQGRCDVSWFDVGRQNTLSSAVAYDFTKQEPQAPSGLRAAERLEQVCNPKTHVSASWNGSAVGRAAQAVATIKSLLVKMIVVGVFVLGAASALTAQLSPTPVRVDTANLDKEIRQFLDLQVAAHVQDIKSLDPPPDRVVGALTTGEFSWGTFMRALAAYSDLAKTRTVAGRDIPPFLAKIGLIELRQGGKTWAQLYAALALRHFGTDLNHNTLWQSLSSADRAAWKSLLDPGRFYDVQTHKLIHLPENYFGVAARIAAISFQLRLVNDRTYVDDLIDRAAQQFTSGGLFADDALPTGRYDRYSNEYARAIYDAAQTVDRTDVMEAVAPSLKEQMRLWWDLLSPDGYGYSWGRSLGAISYMDTMEIAAFVSEHPEFRPAPLSELASAYYAAWRWLRNDFHDDTHLLSVFAFGRGDYSYITREREWQQTTAFLGKLAAAHQTFMNVLTTENVADFSSQVSLRDVARFVYFHNAPGRKFGVWIVRQGEMHFALPFVTGPRAATSDYEPAPHGLPGMATPVEQIYPCLIPFLELEDGITMAAADGADEIHPASNGQSVTATWNRWVVVGAKAGETMDPGVVTEVTWTLVGRSLRRTEVITASKAARVRRIWMAVPSPADHIETSLAGTLRRDRLIAKEGSLEVRILHSDWPIQISALATADDPLGRGARRGIPLHLVLEAKNVSLMPGVAQKWEIELSDLADAHQ
jgi:hypothetical protein